MLIFCYFFHCCFLFTSFFCFHSRLLSAISGDFGFYIFFLSRSIFSLFFVFVLNSALNSHLFSLINLFKYKFVDLVVRFLL